MHVKHLSSTLILALVLTLGLLISLSRAAPGNPDPDPDPHTHAVPPTTTVSLTYDEDMDAVSVSTQTFAVHAFQTGLLTATYGVRGGSIMLTPTRPFFPGELVQTTATTRTLSITGEQPLSYTVWGFRAAVQGGSGAFAPHPSAPTFGAGMSRDIALGDVDGDGDLDAVVANDYGGAQDVYLNDGGGTFSTHPISPTFGASGSQAVTLGDVDGDGDLDAVIANDYVAAQDVYLNDGGGAFSAHPISPTFSIGDISLDVALGDVDGDGDLDAVVANFEAAQDVHLNDGSGVFSAHPISPTFGGVGYSWDLALGDLDGDGDLDAIVANIDAAQDIYLNDGGGAFSPHPNSPTFGGVGDSSAVALGDVDGDGDLDAIIANFGAAQDVYLNDGGGVFSAHPNSPTFGAGNSESVALGDVDGDGDLDAIVANRHEAQDVHLNDGAGAFSAHPNFPTFGVGGSYGLALGDVDGDGDLDAVIANSVDPQTVWLNRDRVSDVVPAPNSHDAALDASLAITASGSISLSSVSTRSLFVHGGFHGHVSGTIASTLLGTGSTGSILYDPDDDWFPGELVHTSVTSSVLDSDGPPLIPYVWGFRAVARGGSGVYATHPSSPTFGTGGSRTIALGDVDGDGDLDALVANDDTAQDVYLNDGSGAFSAHPIFPTFGADLSLGLVLGDLDGDGDLDAIVANYGAAQDVYLNDGSGAFSAHPSSPTFGAGYCWGIALGDVDGDGDLDALIANNGYPQDVYLNDGSGAFSPHPSAPPFGAYYSLAVALGDVDGDGDLDAVVANKRSNFSDAAQDVHLNDGNGIFSAHPISPTFGAGRSNAVALGDVDGDGDLDAVIANTGSIIGEAAQDVYLNDGGGAFSAHPGSPTFGAGSSYGLTLGDVDGDGDLDALVANVGAAQDVYLNDGGGAFSAHPSAPTFGARLSYDVALGDVDGDGDLDALVANVDAVHTVWLNRNYVDLSIIKSVQETRAAPGDPITYTLAFSNNGPQTANNILISDSVPVSVVVSGQWAVGGDITHTPGMTFEWTVRRLAPGQGGVITITGMLTSPLARDHVFGNTASITTLDIDSDTANNNDSTEVTVSNVAPVILDDGGTGFITDQDSAFTTGNVMANDDDLNGDALTVASFDASGALGLVNDNGDGTFDYDPDGQFEYLNKGEQAFDAFSYIASDGSLTDTASVSVTIDGVSDAPTISDILNQYTDVSMPLGPLSFSVGDVDSDLETLSLDAASSDSTLVDPANVSLHGSGTEHTLTLTPTAGMTGTATITVSVSDGALTAWDSFILAVGVNAPPNALDDAVSMPQNTPVAIAVLGNDSDPNGDALSVVAVGQPGNGRANSDGVTVIYTPAQSFVGADAFSYTISDGELSDTATVSVQVLPMADLAISQSYEWGMGVVTYTVVARNLGPSAANGVVVTSALSANVSSVSWTCTAAGAISCTTSGAGNTINDTLASFPAGDVVTYTIGGALDSSDNAVNTASIEPPASVLDPDEDNNSSTLSTANYQVFLPLIIRNATP